MWCIHSIYVHVPYTIYAPSHIIITTYICMNIGAFMSVGHGVRLELRLWKSKDSLA